MKRILLFLLTAGLSWGQDTTTNSATHDHASAAEWFEKNTVTVNKAAGNFSGLIYEWTLTSAPGTDNRLISLLVDGSPVFYIDESGNITGAGTIEINNGVTATKLRVYNTDDGAGNAEYGYLSWDEHSNIFEIGNESTGTGDDSRNLQFQGDTNGSIIFKSGANEVLRFASTGAIAIGQTIRPNATAGSNAIDVGGVSTQFRNGYFGTDLVVGAEIELGHASDTTLARSSAGVVTIEGAEIQTGTDDDTPESGDFGAASALEADGSLSANSVDSDAFVDGSIDHVHLADDVISGATDRTAFASGDKLLIFETGVGMRKVDYDDLPGSGGGLSNVVEDVTPQLGGPLDVNSEEIQSAGNIVMQLGDAAGANKLSVQDSASAEIFSVDSDGDMSLTGITATTGNITTLAFDDSNGSPSSVGEFRYDNTVTGLTDGAMVWNDGTTVRTLVDLMALPSNDDYVVAYDATADGFYMKEDATAVGGGTPDDDSVTPAKMADGDFGFFSVSGNVATPDASAITDAHVSNTLTSSLFVGSGSTTTAIDLATAEAAGTLPVAKGGTGVTTSTGTGATVRGTSPTLTTPVFATKINLPNAATDASLTTSGDMHFNTTDEQISVHSAADGEISGEASLSLIQTYSITFDPKAVSDGNTDRLFMFQVGDDFPEGLIIDEWTCSFLVDPTTEVDMDLKRASAVIGATGATVMDVLDTTAGVSSEDTDANINAGAVVANGQWLYLEIGTAYVAEGEQIIFQIWYHGEED